MVFQRPADAESRAAGETVRYQWLTPERQTQLRGVLLGITLFFGLSCGYGTRSAPQVRMAPT
jgi:hypothetical protein